MITESQKQAGYTYSPCRKIHQELFTSDHISYVRNHLRKIIWTKKILSCALDYKHILAISGGKDSLVLLHLAVVLDKPFKAYMFHNEREPVAMINLTWKISDRVRILCPFPSWNYYTNRYGEPKPWLRWCTEKLKIRPMKALLSDVVVLGTRREESYRRKKRGYFWFWKGQVQYAPLFFWDTWDIWFYHGYNQIECWKGYLQGHQRCGCIPCIFSNPNTKPKKYKPRARLALDGES